VPGAGCPGRRDAKERVALDELSPAVQEHWVVGGWSMLGNDLGCQNFGFEGGTCVFFNEMNHGMFMFWVCVKSHVTSVATWEGELLDMPSGLAYV